MHEIETKVLEVERDEIEKKLNALGAKKISEERLTVDWYGPKGLTHDGDDPWFLRVRTYGATGKHEVTWKAKSDILGTARKHKEINFTVSDFSQAGDLFDELDLEKYVVITGPRKDTNVILEASDIFVNLSPEENFFSVAIQESMAKKTTCLLTNAGQTEKTFTHKENVYLVNPKSPEETADAIIKLLTNKKLCKKLGENGIKLLKKHRYTKDDIINELNSLYKKLVN